MSHLLDLSPEDVAGILQVFKSEFPSGMVGRTGFTRVFANFLRTKRTGAVLPKQAVADIVSKLFAIFDRDNDGVVDSRELLAGLSIMCKGDGSDRIRTAFTLFDENGDGVISLDEMIRYLTSMFCVIAEAQPEVFERYNISPDELGEITARRCFQEADTDGNGVLSFDEFKRFYTSETGVELLGSVEASVGKVSAPAPPTSSSFDLIHRARESTGLGSLAAKDVFSQLRKECPGGLLRRAEFTSAIFKVLLSAGALPTSSAAAADLPGILDELFDRFDVDHNGVVDMTELASGLTLLCGGSKDDRIRAAFETYDLNHDGVISLDEMTAYLLSVFRVMADAHPDVQLSVPIEDLARVTAEDCFHRADTNGDGSITFDEFKSWYSDLDESDPAAVTAPLPRPQAPPPPPPLPAPPAMPSVQLPSWIPAARRLTGLEGKSVDDVLPTFASAADGASRLNRSAFATAFATFMDRAELAANKKAIAATLSQMFDAFDADHNGYVDFRELAAGLTLLCGSSKEDRVKSMFKLLDSDGDGTISMDEMVSYMRSVFSLMLASKPEVLESTGLSVDDIALCTAEKCFSEADLNGDGSITYEEFQEWFQNGGGAELIESVTPKRKAPSAAAPTPATTKAVRGEDDAQLAEEEVEEDADDASPLVKLRTLTGLGNLFVTDAVSHFASYADPDGSLDQRAFLACFDDVAEPLSPDNREQIALRQQVLLRLFDAFDRDGNGKVDFAELCGGLSILCNGPLDVKFESGFLLLDADNDGYISKAEMFSYLRSVFKVLLQASTESIGATGQSVAELARDATEACFAVADTDGDGKLSKTEFKNWFLNHHHVPGLGPEAVAANDTIREFVTQVTAVAPLTEITKILNLASAPVRQVVPAVLRHADKYNTLSRVAFIRAFEAFVLPNTDPKRAHVLLNSLFSLFDADDNGYVDAAELAAGISVLCHGSPDDKVLAAFQALDLHHDGVLTVDEVYLYLTTVFKVLFAVDGASDVNVDEIATQSALQCFAEADKDRDGEISLTEFIDWYSSPTAGAEEQGEKPVPTQATADPLAVLRMCSGLVSYDAEDVFEHFVRYTDPRTGKLSLDAYLDAFSLFVPLHATSADDLEVARATRVELFGLFDVEQEGQVDYTTLMCGLSVLCAGDGDAKLTASFKLLSLAEDGSLTLEDTQQLLTGVYRVLLWAKTRAVPAGLSADELAASGAKECFAVAGLAPTDTLSVESFKAWYLGGGSPGVSLGVESAPASDEVPPPVPTRYSALADAKAASRLDKVSVTEAQAAVAAVVARDGRVPKGAFLRALAKLTTPPGGRPSAVSQQVLGNLFDLFDPEATGWADYAQLASGVTVLCGDSHDAKAEATFKLYDFDGDGVITKPEMIQYLTSVFKVMYAVSAGAEEAIGASPADLAAATTSQCFADADVNEDGVLSLDEFKRWYLSGSATASAAGAKKVVLEAADKPSWMTLSNVIDIIGLRDTWLSVVIKHFVRFTDSSGSLSRAAFNAAFRQFAKSTTDPSLHRTVVQHLYNLFDVNHDGKVDFTELMAGLSVLCGGSGPEKVETAFKLYDSNGDGYISFDEMVSYLVSVFKVLDGFDPELYSGAGVSPQTLAAATAAKCFVDADVDEDGKLSFEEFQAWYLAGEGEDSEEDEEEEDSEESDQAPFDAAPVPQGTISLDVVKSVVNLEGYSVREVASKFAGIASDEGQLSRAGFNRVFRELVPEDASLTPQQKALRRTVLSGLFDLFDADGNDLVDFQELVTGLAVLCGGDRDERIRAAFALFDTNGDGYISLPEMITYLSSVFRVMYATREETKRLGVSAAELAQVTAEQCFSVADADGDGRLSWEEFKAWYTADSFGEGPAGPARDIVMSSLDVRPAKVTLTEARELSGLKGYPIERVLAHFGQYTDRNGELTRAGFYAAFEAVAPSGRDADEAALRRREVLRQLFELFDTNQNGSVDFAELLSGLSVLCDGTREDKVKAAFQLYDENGDGFISLSEMVSYLSAVFKVVYASEPGTEEMVGCSAEDLALATASQCFADADTNHDGKLSLEEFSRWYSSRGESQEPRVAASVVGLAAEPPSWVSLGEMKRLTGLHRFSVAEVASHFARFADDMGLLSPSSFGEAFITILDSLSLSEHDRSRAELVLSRLFTVFDKDSNGVVDFSELISGLSVLCGGSHDDKIRQAFDVMDTDGDGLISLEEMIAFLTAVFKIVRPSETVPPREIAEATAQACFAEADTDGDGKISFDQYQQWSNSEVPVTPVPSPPQQEDVEDEFSVLNHIRSMLLLESATVEDLLGVFEACEDEDGNISEADFERCIRALMLSKGATSKELSACRPISRRVFRAFDSNSNGLVDHDELVSGLSVLCAGSQDDKIRAVFNLYDENGDGVISVPEMTKYLTAVFRVIYDTVPGTADQLGVSPEELAKATTAKCFREADTNQDGNLTLDEFKRWFLLHDGELPNVSFSTSVIDKPASPAQAAAADYAEDAEGSELSTDTASEEGEWDSGSFPSATVVRSVLKLDEYTVGEVFEVFRDQAQKGVLTRNGFGRALLLLAQAGGRSVTSAIVELINVLFRLFDKDGNGVVDFEELACGISVFCSGTTDEKVKAAFQLYDLNGDGYISLEEMQRYLLSVFRVMYTVNPSFQETNRVDAPTLAHITAQKAFEDCDLNHDGLLSFDEFKLWYSSQE